MPINEDVFERFKTLAAKLNNHEYEEIIDLISSVKGVGLWTVQMFLMFTLNRPDIFPVTDLALQKGYSAFYKKKHLLYKAVNHIIN